MQKITKDDYKVSGRYIIRGLLFCYFLFLVGCATKPTFYTPAPKKATSKPYKITNSHMKNKWFYPKHTYEHVEEGEASYYGGGDGCHGRKTSTGEIFDKNQLTAAHRTLPLPSIIRVTNLENGRTLKVKVVDRGPFAHIDRRIIDVSEKAAKMLGFYQKGVARVRIETVINESIRLAQGQSVPLKNRTAHDKTISVPGAKIHLAHLDRKNLKLGNKKHAHAPKHSLMPHKKTIPVVALPDHLFMAEGQVAVTRSSKVVKGTVVTPKLKKKS